MIDHLADKMFETYSISDEERQSSTTGHESSVEK